MLALDRHALIIEVAPAAFSGGTTRKPVASVDLDCRLGGQNLKHTAALGRIKLGGGLKLSRLITINHPTVIIAFAEFQGREILFYLGSNPLEFLEIHRGPRG